VTATDKMGSGKQHILAYHVETYEYGIGAWDGRRRCSAIYLDKGHAKRVRVYTTRTRTAGLGWPALRTSCEKGGRLD